MCLWFCLFSYCNMVRLGGEQMEWNLKKNCMAFWTGTQVLEGYFWLCNSLVTWPWTRHPTLALTSSTKMKGLVQVPCNVCSFLCRGFQYLPLLPYSHERNMVFRHQLSLCKNVTSHLVGFCHVQNPFISTISFDFNQSHKILKTFMILCLTQC